MSLSNSIFLYIFSFFFSFSILKIIVPFFSNFLIDKPNKRSSHIKPTASGGGLSFVITTIIFSYFTKSLIPLYCLPLALIGFIDDLINLSSVIRFSFQTLTIFVISANSSYFFGFEKNMPIIIEILFYIFLIIFGTGLINFFNFMDGLDGFISGNISLFLLIFIVFFDPNLIPLAGSLLAFTYVNWHPAKIFMGDCGSTFLGAICFYAIINRDNTFDSLGLFLILSPIIFDAFFTLIRRFLAGHNIFNSHKLHLYQRLNQSGMSHSKVSIIYMIILLTNSLIYVFSGLVFTIYFCILIIVIGIILDKYFALDFKTVTNTSKS